MCQLSQCKLITVLLKLRHNLDSQHADMWLIANRSRLNYDQKGMATQFGSWVNTQPDLQLTLSTASLKARTLSYGFNSDLDTYNDSLVGGKPKMLHGFALL